MGYLSCDGCGGDFRGGRPFTQGFNSWCQDCAPSFLVDKRERRRRRSRNRPSRAMVAEVVERDGDACAYCGEAPERLEMDHIVPVSRGGETVAENLTPACGGCNRSKADKLVDEWGGPNGE